jgi:hypothetical protein
MRIVFGHNNFRVKAVAPIEIGIVDESFKNCMFELRQKYGHLFWIPCIPLGQIWVLKKPNGHIYDCPRGIEQKLESIKPKGLSIFAFSGPLLGLAIMLLIPVFDQLQNAKYASENKKYMQQKSKTLDVSIDNLETNDYLVFESADDNNEYSNTFYPPVKVLKITNDSVTLGNMFNNNLSQEYRAYNSDIDNNEIVALELKNGIKEIYTIEKNKLKKAIPYNAENEKNKGIQIAQINFAIKIILKNIAHTEGPILKLSKLENSTDYTYLEFENIGFDATVDSVVGENNNTSDWKLSANHNFKNGKNIALKTISGTNAKLYCSDAAKHKYIFDLDNNNGHWEYDFVKIIK